jgi:hypothetical protein
MFLFGAIVGAMMFSGDSTSMLGSNGLMGIPLRCLYVTSEQGYRDCRKLSMQRELLAQSTTDPASVGQCYYRWASRMDTSRLLYNETDCNWNYAITLELEALRVLNAQMAKKAGQ